VERCEVCLDIYRWSEGVAVTGPIRDIGQNILRSAFVTGSSSSSSHSYCHVLCRMAFIGVALLEINN